MAVTIRQACKDDIPFIAQMILAAMHIEKQKDNTLVRRMEELVTDDATLYSWQRATIALDDDDSVGLCLAYDGSDYHERRIRTFTMKCSDGRSVADDNPTLLEQADETTDGEYYIDSLAVTPHYRGHGLGKILLNHAIQQAKLLGLTPTLLVDPENTPALRLYTSLGFRFSHEQPAFGIIYHKYHIN